MKNRFVNIPSVLVLLFLGVFALHSMAETIEPTKKLIYKEIDSTTLKLHVFEPENFNPKVPTTTVVFFFGGGWAGGNPKQFYEQARDFADQGILAISAEYRISSKHKTTPFDAVADAKSAIRWVREHAIELGADPNRIIASGGSAGGHIASCTGVIDGLDTDGEDLSISSVPNAMILFNPVLDTTEKGYGLKKVTEARKTEISPCHHVHAGIVPTIVFHGTGDTTVPFANAARFVTLMKEAGNTCTLVPFEGANHGFFNGKFFRPKSKDVSAYFETVKQSITFLEDNDFL